MLDIAAVLIVGGLIRILRDRLDKRCRFESTRGPRYGGRCTRPRGHAGFVHVDPYGGEWAEQ